MNNDNKDTTIHVSKILKQNFSLLIDETNHITPLIYIYIYIHTSTFSVFIYIYINILKTFRVLTVYTDIDKITIYLSTNTKTYLKVHECSTYLKFWWNIVDRDYLLLYST